MSLLPKVLLIVASLACVAQADMEFVQPIADSDYRRFSRRQKTDDNNCTMRQFCLERNPDDTCKDPTKTGNPILGSWAPEPLPPSAMFKFMAICPFYKMGTPVCCNKDQVDIMTTNFLKID